MAVLNSRITYQQTYYFPVSGYMIMGIIGPEGALMVPARAIACGNSLLHGLADIT